MSETPWIPAQTLVALTVTARLSALREAAEAIRRTGDELKRDERPLPVGVHYSHQLQVGLDLALAAVTRLLSETEEAK